MLATKYGIVNVSLNRHSVSLFGPPLVLASYTICTCFLGRIFEIDKKFLKKRTPLLKWDEKII